MIKELIKKIVVYTVLIYMSMTLFFNTYVVLKNEPQISEFINGTKDRITVDTIENLIDINKLTGESEIAIANLENIVYSIIIAVLIALIFSNKNNKLKQLVIFIFGDIIFTGLITMFVIYKGADFSFQEEYLHMLINAFIPYAIIFSIFDVIKILYKEINKKH